MLDCLLTGIADNKATSLGIETWKLGNNRLGNASLLSSQLDSHQPNDNPKGVIMSRLTETYIDNLMVNESILSPSDEFSFNANIKSRHERDRMYRRSIEEPESFWAEMAEKYLDWFQKWDAVEEFDFYSDKPYVKYFRGAKLNVSYNCLDRHLKGARRNKAAIIWQGEPDEDYRTITYAQLHREVCKAANMLKHLGVEKGDRVVIYMPMIPELAISMLACSRIGAIHCVVFGGLSADSLRDRIQDSGAKVVLTANYGHRAGKLLKTKAICDEALDECPDVNSCVVVRRVKDRSPEMIHHRDHWWEDLMDRASYDCEPEHVDAEDPLFILYTSGSTAKPKGILHTSGGYLLYATMTTKYVFDLKEDDVYWCTADAGWITGHTYLVYGPLSNGATALMFEGVPSYPEPDRFWEVVEKYGVNILYTAPTTIRSMMKEGDQWPLGRDLSSLRLLGTVGEPITSKAWLWYYTVIGKRRSPIVDTWWQTETGGVLITTIPGAVDMKPGSAALPFFGVSPKVINNEGQETGVNEGGNLVLTRPWPGMMRGVYGNEEAFKNIYFPEPGYYVSGDGAYKDEDGYYWLLGRVDDVIKVSAHRIGAAEVESALVSHEKVAEAAVVGYPHCVKGEGIYAYVTVTDGTHVDDTLRRELIAHVRHRVGPIATPDVIHFADALPKTRSGKIMRRILRKVAADDTEELGDTSTLTDPSVVDSLIVGHILFKSSS